MPTAYYGEWHFGPAPPGMAAKLVLPSFTVTVPDGTPAPPDALTVTLSTIDCPNRLGLGDAVNVVVVALLFTTC